MPNTYEWYYFQYGSRHERENCPTSLSGIRRSTQTSGQCSSYVQRCYEVLPLNRTYTHRKTQEVSVIIHWCRWYRDHWCHQHLEYILGTNCVANEPSSYWRCTTQNSRIFSSRTRVERTATATSAELTHFDARQTICLTFVAASVLTHTNVLVTNRGKFQPRRYHFCWIREVKEKLW